MIVIFITVSVTVSAAVLWNLSLGFQRRCSQQLFIVYVMLCVHWVKRLKMFSSIKDLKTRFVVSLVFQLSESRSCPAYARLSQTRKLLVS